jgi:hypothetical protein
MDWGELQAKDPVPELCIRQKCHPELDSGSKKP